MKRSVADPGRQPLYFVHPLVDLLMMGGLSIAALGAFAIYDWPREDVYRLSFALLVLCNYPHFAATSQRLYGSPEARAQYPYTTYGAPLLVLGGVVASLLSPAFVAPAFVKLFLLWSPFHFSAQTVGLTVLYSRRAGVTLDGWPRRFLTIWVFGSFVAAQAIGESAVTTQTFYSVHFPLLGIPEWLGNACLVVMYAAMAAFLGWGLSWSISQRRVLPWILLVPGVAQLCWFILGAGTPGYREFVPFFHSLQYVLVAFVLQLKLRSEIAVQESSRFRVGRESLKWFGLAVLLGYFLFEGAPRILSAWTGLEVGLALAVFIAGVQLHHFFVDGVIWKLRDPRVRSPLLADLGGILRSPARRPAVAAAAATAVGG
jgi:hypothetical protein